MNTNARTRAPSIVHTEIRAFLRAHPDWSPVTQNAYRRGIERLDFYLESRGLHWKLCQAQELDAYGQSLLWQGKFRGGLYSPHTIYQALQAVRLFYRWAQANALIAHAPVAHWRLSRPPRPPKATLSRELLLKLLNLPDLSRPQGQRDQLLLELLQLGLRLPECRQLRLDPLEKDRLLLPRDLLRLEDSAAAALARYLESGRPQLLRKPTTVLLLTANGRPFIADESFRGILRGYQKQLGSPHSLSPGRLRYSYLEQVRQLRQRRAPSGLEFLS